jgi:hypothetical protein
MKEPDVSRPARAAGGAVPAGGLTEGFAAGTGVDLLASGGGAWRTCSRDAW